MAERQTTKTELIEAEIYKDSIHSNFVEIMTRREEQRTGWFVASVGMFASELSPLYDQIYKHDEYFRTDSKLVGSIRKLNGNTTIAAQSLLLPRDISKDGINEFLHNRKERDAVTRRFGYVSLNEPGFPLLRPIKTETGGYIEIKLTGKPLATEAIRRYLNTAESFDHDFSSVEIGEQIKATYAGIRASIPSMSEMLQIMKDESELQRQQEIYFATHPEEAAIHKAEEDAKFSELANHKWLPLI